MGQAEGLKRRPGGHPGVSQRNRWGHVSSGGLCLIVQFGHRRKKVLKSEDQKLFDRRRSETWISSDPVNVVSSSPRTRSSHSASRNSVRSNNNNKIQ